MIKIIVITEKKKIDGHMRSLDVVLRHFKNNLHFKYSRWVSINGATARIGRTSYQRVVIPALERINSAIAKSIPGFIAFQIVREPWRSNKFHKSISKHKAVNITEDEHNFYIEVDLENEPGK